MDVCCPQCGTEQTAAARGEGGLLRCQVCGTRWMARPYEGMLPIADHRQIVIDAEVIAEESPAAVEQHTTDAVRSARSGHPWLRNRRLRVLGIGSAVLAAIFAFGAPLVAALPDGERLPSGSELLAFRKITSETVRLGAVDTLIVRGEIVNRAPETVALPAVEVTLRAEGGEVLTAWLVEPATETLSPGGHIGFRTVLEAPPEGAAQVSLNLAGRDSASR